MLGKSKKTNLFFDNKDSGAFVRLITFLLLGVVIVGFAFFFLINPILFFESATLFSDGETQSLIGFGNDSFSAFVTASLFWLLFLSITGFPWAHAFLAKSDIIERVLFAIIFGFFAMSFNIFLATSVAVVHSFLGGDSLLTTELINKINNIFESNQEQGYAFLNVLIWFVVGVMVLIAKEVVIILRQR